jgi:hypothetical protein
LDYGIKSIDVPKDGTTDVEKFTGPYLVTYNNNVLSPADKIGELKIIENQLNALVIEKSP